MNINFNQKELSAIGALARHMETSGEQVVIQALRMFELYKTGRIQLTFPSMLNLSKSYYDVVDVEGTTDSVNPVVLMEDESGPWTTSWSDRNKDYDSQVGMMGNTD